MSYIYINNGFVLCSKAYLIKAISYSLSYFAYNFKTHFGNPWIAKKQIFFFLSTKQNFQQYSIIDCKVTWFKVLYSNLHVHVNPLDICYNTNSDSWSMRWCLRFCIPNKLLHAADLGSHFVFRTWAVNQTDLRLNPSSAFLAVKSLVSYLVSPSLTSPHL